ncbi:hypothetical protein N0V95_004392 [Ascochyta clinopodiicola]|nr:hypothetical protein N0V95_004392 [Ascochyta clinopodiicola]
MGDAFLMTVDIANVGGKGDVVADINYFPPLGEPIPTSVWKKRYLGVGDEHTRAMTIRDVRPTLQDHDLDINGFKFLRLTPRRRVDSLSTEDTIRHEYYPELEYLAKSL